MSAYSLVKMLDAHALHKVVSLGSGVERMAQIVALRIFRGAIETGEEVGRVWSVHQETRSCNVASSNMGMLM